MCNICTKIREDLKKAKPNRKELLQRITNSLTKKRTLAHFEELLDEILDTKLKETDKDAEKKFYD